MQWNEAELAWAKKNKVNLGTKTAGGLSQNADYQRITGGGGQSKPSTPSGGLSTGGYGGAKEYQTYLSSGGKASEQEYIAYN